ncbi:Retrovirus-related Pol polyprotein from transposon TNT 1-94-like protein [Drosera capensis]
MQEALNDFQRNEVWYLTPRPKNYPVVGSKWVFRNKSDENRIVIRNKARLLAKGDSQENGIDFDETFPSVARLEDIRMFLAYAAYQSFKVYQMDVKKTFLNGKLQEKVYVEQPPGFEGSEYPRYVYRLDKALYGLKQAVRAWYEPSQHSYVKINSKELISYTLTGSKMAIYIEADDFAQSFNLSNEGSRIIPPEMVTIGRHAILPKDK